jgi:hypothetical protein
MASASTPSKKIAIDEIKEIDIPYTDVASPYKFDGIVLLIIDNMFPGQTSAHKIIK